MKAAFSTTEAAPATLGRVRRARAFHRPGRLVLVTALWITALLAFAVFVAASVAMVWSGERHMGFYALAALAVFGACRLLVFVLARSLNCALCYGPVLHEKPCRKHRDALRLPLLSHRASAAVSVACTGSFRCMYCGTPYRLRK